MAKNKKTFWIFLALLAALIAAPHATIIKLNLANTDPMFYNIVRYSMVTLICGVLLLGKFKKLSSEGLRLAVISGIAFSLAVTFYVLAIEASQASYVATLALINPIVFIAVSSATLRERIKHKVVAGMTLAMIGALVIVAGPIIFSQGTSVGFYPEATFYMLIQSISFAVALVWMRRANEAKLPIIAVVGVQGIVVLVVSFGLFLAFGDWDKAEFTPTLIGSAAYSAIGIALIVRSLNTLVYEKLGSAIVGSMTYLEVFLAILIPILILGEKLSLIMIFGGVLILSGIYIIEYRKSHRRHSLFHYHRHH
ncbi:EamA family transporter [Candidatus Saccharibacteria bacterium]|nr:EamA family transporter [Candidatus Saccharibacteria bacterium]